MKDITTRAQRAMFSILKRSKVLNLPIDIQLTLFDSMVTPILLYGCETWENENIDVIEKLYISYCKYVLHLKTSTPTCMVLGELGRGLMVLEMKIRMLRYWDKLLDPFISKLNCKLYNFLYHLHHERHFSSPWLLHIEKLLNDTGFCNIWIRQEMSESTWLNVNIKQRPLDQYIQNWRSDCDIGVKCYNYRLFKSDYMFEKYLIDLPDALEYIVCKFRTVNHKLPIETGRYTRIPRNERVCKMCNSGQLGDEFHFCLECPALKELRNTFLPANSYKRPNVVNFGRILNIKNKITLVNIAKFIKFGLDMCTH